jgi:hypothetical protein
MVYMQQVLESSLTSTKCIHGRIQKGKLRKLLLIRKCTYVSPFLQAKKALRENGGLAPLCF